MTSETPIYIQQDPEAYAAEQKARLLAIGISEEAAEERRLTILKVAVRVKNAHESNAIQSGRQ